MSTETDIMIILFLILSISAYEILLDRYEMQCFGEDLPIDTHYIGEAKISDPSSVSTFAIFVYNKDTEIIYHNPQTKNDKFSFITTKNSFYNFCLTNLKENEAVVQFTIRTGVKAKDYSSLPSAKDIKLSEKRVIMIKDSIDEILKTLKSIKARDTELKNANEMIQKRIILYSIISFALLITLTIVQMLYFKKFLKSKKMI